MRRLRRQRALEPAIYVRNGVSADAGPFGDMTLPDVACQVLGDRSMNFTELAVAMLEAGYQTTMSSSVIFTAVPMNWKCSSPNLDMPWFPKLIAIHYGEVPSINTPWAARQFLSATLWIVGPEFSIPCELFEI